MLILGALLIFGVLLGSSTAGYFIWKKTQSLKKASAGMLSPSTLLFLYSQSGKFEKTQQIQHILLIVILAIIAIVILFVVFKIWKRVRRKS